MSLRKKKRHLTCFFSALQFQRHRTCQTHKCCKEVPVCQPICRVGFLCVYLASGIATSSAYSIHFQSHDQIISRSGQVHLQNCLSSPASPHLLRLQSSVLPPGTGLEKSVAAAAWHAHTKGMMAPKSKGAQSQTKVQIPPGDVFNEKLSPKFEGGNKGCWDVTTLGAFWKSWNVFWCLCPLLGAT